MKFFGQYRAVHTNENSQSNMESGGLATPTTEPINDKFTKSLKANRSINKGFSIVDVFFNKRKAGRGPRWPKGKFKIIYFASFVRGRQIIKALLDAHNTDGRVICTAHILFLV